MSKQKPDQKNLFPQMEEHRKKLAHIKVDPNLDLSALANEMAGHRNGLRVIIEQAERDGFIFPAKK